MPKAKLSKEKKMDMHDEHDCCGGDGCDCGSWGKWKHNHHGGGHWTGIYGLGFAGAAIYYLQQATTFWGGVLGILKAFVWPAMLVYNALQFLKM